MPEKELEQSELYKTDVSWFHIFKELIRNKTWARLSSNSKSLYPVIKAYVNHQNGVAFPSMSTLEEYSGISRPSVNKALKELEAVGLLIKTSGGKTSSNKYSMVEKFDVKDADGRPAASVSFDYLPGYVTDAVAELKNFMAEGLTLPDGKTQFIKIDNLTLNIMTGPNATTINTTADKEAILKGMKDLLDGKNTVEASLVKGLPSDEKKH